MAVFLYIWCSYVFISISLVCPLYGWTRLLRIQANWFCNYRVWFLECFLPLDWCLQFWSSVHLIDLILQCYYNGKTERLNLHPVKQRSTLHKHHIGRQNLSCCETLSTFSYYNGVLQHHLCSRKSLLYKYSLGLIFENYLQCSLFENKDVTIVSPMHVAFSDGNQRNRMLYGLYSNVVRRLVEHTWTEKENSKDSAWSLSELMI